MSLRRQLIIGAIIQIGVTLAILLAWHSHAPLDQFLAADVAILAGVLTGFVWAFYRYFVDMRAIKRKHLGR